MSRYQKYRNRKRERFQEKESFINNISLRYKILIGVIILNLIVFYFTSRYIYFVYFGDIIFVLIWLYGWSKNCPRCHSHWARQLEDRTHFGTYTGFHKVNRNMTHRDERGNYIGSSSYRDINPVTMHTIQNHWVCKYCNYSWSGRIHDVEN